MRPSSPYRNLLGLMSPVEHVVLRLLLTSSESLSCTCVYGWWILWIKSMQQLLIVASGYSLHYYIYFLSSILFSNSRRILFVMSMSIPYSLVCCCLVSVWNSGFPCLVIDATLCHGHTHSHTVHAWLECTLCLCFHLCMMHRVQVTLNENEWAFCVPKMNNIGWNDASEEWYLACVDSITS